MYLCEFARHERLNLMQCIHCNLRSSRPRARRCRNQQYKPNRPQWTVTKKVTNGLNLTRLQPKVIRDHFACVYIGQPYEDQVECKSCGCSTAKAYTTVFECTQHGECTPNGKALHEDIMACIDCNLYQFKEPQNA